MEPDRKNSHKIIHSYFWIALDIVWNIVTIDIPNLKEKTEKILAQEGFETD